MDNKLVKEIEKALKDAYYGDVCGWNEMAEYLVAKGLVFKSSVEVDPIICGGWEKALEVFDSETFTLNQYLKDPDMKIHEKRFNKMLAAMETVRRIFEYLSTTDIIK